MFTRSLCPKQDTYGTHGPFPPLVGTHARQAVPRHMGRPAAPPPPSYLPTQKTIRCATEPRVSLNPTARSPESPVPSHSSLLPLLWRASSNGGTRPCRPSRALNNTEGTVHRVAEIGAAFKCGSVRHATMPEAVNHDVRPPPPPLPPGDAARACSSHPARRRSSTIASLGHPHVVGPGAAPLQSLHNAAVRCCMMRPTVFGWGCEKENARLISANLYLLGFGWPMRPATAHKPSRPGRFYSN